jgi:hypothetical protein
MHNNEFEAILSKFATFTDGILPIFFWLFLIFSFDSPKIAAATVIAIAIHELGHIVSILCIGGDLSGMRGAISGLRIKGRAPSYGSELLIYLGGPLANAMAALISLLFLPNEFAEVHFAVNFATCISNLLPVEGYDGYGILRCLVMKLSDSCHTGLLGGISLFTTSALAISSLYLMDRIGEGYWLFFVFFLSTLKKLGDLLEIHKNEK